MIEINTKKSNIFKNYSVPIVNEDFFLDKNDLNKISVKLNIKKSIHYLMPKEIDSVDACENCCLNKEKIRCESICSNGGRNFFSKIYFREAEQYELLFLDKGE